MKQINGFIVKANYTRYSFGPGEGQTALDFAKIAARSMVKDSVCGGVELEVITEDEPEKEEA